MSDLEKVLIESIDKFNGAVDKGVDFALTQAPEVVQELLLWKSVTSFIGFAFGVLMLGLGFVYVFYTVRSIIKTRPEKGGECNLYWDAFVYHNPSLTVYSAVVFPVLTLSHTTVFLTVAIQNNDWLKIWIAPKLYLLEYAASLVK